MLFILDLQIYPLGAVFSNAIGRPSTPLHVLRVSRTPSALALVEELESESGSEFGADAGEAGRSRVSPWWNAASMSSISAMHFSGRASMSSFKLASSIPARESEMM